MITLSNLSNPKRLVKKARRVGRGIGSKRGKTCGRGVKGAKARTGYKRRHGQEGGQLPLFRKLPTRGFTNARFQDECFAIDINFINDSKHFKDGDTVSLAILQEKGLAPRLVPGGLKVLGNTTLTKKVSIEAQAFSKAAEAKLNEAGVSYQVVSINA